MSGMAIDVAEGVFVGGIGLVLTIIVVLYIFVHYVKKIEKNSHGNK